MENWIIISIGLLISSVSLYLLIRKSNKTQMGVSIQNLGMFLLPTIFVGIYCLIIGQSFVVSIRGISIIMFASIFFSWLGNIASLHAIKKAPNSGYSLVISKSYVLLTTIISFWFFNSPLNLKSIIAIILIVLFSAFIIIDKKKNNSPINSTWIWLTMVAFFAWGFLALTLKYLIGQGLQSTIILFYLMLFVSIMIIIQFIFQKTKIKISKHQIPTFLFIGVASTFFNLFNIVGYKYAPNPGYINAVNAASIALVTIFSAAIFKDDLTTIKIIGVIGVVSSLILLFV